jgi:hypothetical protein
VRARLSHGCTRAHTIAPHVVIYRSAYPYVCPQGGLPFRVKDETTPMRVTERATVVFSLRVLQIRARDGHDGLRLARNPDAHAGSWQSNTS